MDDRRVHIYFENALKYIRRCEEEYDRIIVDSSDPFGPAEGCLLYTSIQYSIAVILFSLKVNLLVCHGRSPVSYTHLQP